MAVKVRDLYESVKKQDIELIAGKNGLDNVVRWVHMVENIETSVFLEGQEIAFTTGIGLRKKDDLFELVKYTYENHASGMVISTGPYIAEISDEIIEFCDEKNFPFFIVPWHVYFAEIMREFCYKITVSDKIDMELTNAIKNAIFFEKEEDLYVPQFEMHKLKADWSYCLAIIEISERDTGKIIDKEKQTKALRNIENTLISHSFRYSFVLELDGRFVLLFAKYDEDTIKEMVESIKENLENLLEHDEKMCFCIGKSTRNIKCVAKSYRKALDVLRLQKRRGKYDEVTIYKDLGLYKLLLSMEDTNAMKEYSQETIEPLINYDYLNSTDYVLILETYLSLNGSVKDVAAKLSVHRNTINYKIKKIEEILSCDLSDLDTRLILRVGLMIKKIT
ncbi:PucR family transcriptional regulator ligand-binding domain-containing protein [uncultured Ilyobacter sp.]|uniref:PucR family transcriptional regulator n=1 Tax=uncultured Ilyobacter sp. TaxID=544433 RepID=UPI0029BFCDE6|nr:PucR family transcriptional regulator ligand-binding domain-containing protein [uncultured Ilyobacter sp.]